MTSPEQAEQEIVLKQAEQEIVLNVSGEIDRVTYHVATHNGHLLEHTRTSNTQPLNGIPIAEWVAKMGAMVANAPIEEITVWRYDQVVTMEQMNVVRRGTAGGS